MGVTGDDILERLPNISKLSPRQVPPSIKTYHTSMLVGKPFSEPFTSIIIPVGNGWIVA